MQALPWSRGLRGPLPSTKDLASLFGPNTGPHSTISGKVAQCRCYPSWWRRTAGTRDASTSSSSFQSSAFPLPASTTATPYEIFHLSRHATQADIKARYYDLVKVYHPDRTGASSSSISSSSSSKMQQSPDLGDFQRIQEAYSVLSDQRKRKLYDVSGIGWDAGRSPSAFAGPAPPYWGGGYPSNARDRAAYDAWSDHLRRSAPSGGARHGWEYRGSAEGHDRFGWQSFAGRSSSSESDYFYGYGHTRQFGRGSASASRYTGNHNNGLYTTNQKFFTLVSALTFVLAIGQFIRLREESKMVANLADRKHMDAAKSLDEARKMARSEVGKMRLEEMRKRNRERKLNGETDSNGNGEGEAWDPNQIGHGGPSGRSSYEERIKRLEAA